MSVSTTWPGLMRRCVCVCVSVSTTWPGLMRRCVSVCECINYLAWANEKVCECV